MYTRLNAEKIVETTERLSRRIKDRFPESNLCKVSAELSGIAHKAKALGESLGRPLYVLRFIVLATIAALLGGMVWATLHLHITDETFAFTDLVTVLDAGINVLVLTGGGMFFLITVETRVKRSRMLKALHVLRSLAHVIDMHQLTKDPYRLEAGSATASSPSMNMTAYELSRYLDYCSEMLAHIGKLAALYIQNFDDSVAVAAVNDIEDLTTSLSRKIWQKIMILDAREKGTTPSLQSEPDGTQPSIS